jgi:predicted nucleic acid-binding protein
MVAAARPDLTPAFVLDCSVALAWFFADERSAYADAVLLRLPSAAAVVPALWHLEVANGMIQGEKRRRSTPAQAARFAEFLAPLPITVDRDTIGRAWSDTLHVARSFGLSAYDAAYLELALRRGLPIAAGDGRLKAAAAASGVALFEP